MSKTKRKVAVLKKEVVLVSTGVDFKPQQCQQITEYSSLSAARKAMHDEALTDMVHIATKYTTHTSEFTENSCKISTPCYTHCYTVEEKKEDYNFNEDVTQAMEGLDSILSCIHGWDFNEANRKAEKIREVLSILLKEVTYDERH